MFNEFLNKKIAILWFWKEWKSTLEFLKKVWVLEKNITILDKNNIEFDDFFWKIITWENYLKNIDNFDLIFKSPWFSIYQNKIEYLKPKILTQSSIFFKYYTGKIIAVTQTKWKSTTSTLIYNMLKNSGFNVKFVWNIWNPVLSEIDLTKYKKSSQKQEFWERKNLEFSEDLDFDYIVYELSSYMMDDIWEYFHSEISILWNIYKDHLDWHNWFENYSNAKLNILKNSKNVLFWYRLFPNFEKYFKKDFLIFWWEKWNYTHLWNEFFINWISTQKKVSPKIPWDHNFDNFCAVLWVADLLKIDLEIFKKTINKFSGLPHRLENIWEYFWITFIDDWISTNPDSTIFWIQAFKDKKIWTMFIGGEDRWYDFFELSEVLKQKEIFNIVLFPESGLKLKDFFDERFNFIITRDMRLAVEFAFKNTKTWEICLMSTASPSYSIWKSFEEKWKLFKEEIEKYSFKNTHL